MSRIPKLPNTTSSSSKENKPGLLNTRTLPNYISRNINNISEVDKKNLFSNHTKPLKKVTNNCSAGPSNSVAGSNLKRSATDQPLNVQAKKKPNVVAPKIPPYDYKARFNDLVGKHKVLKNDYNDLKEKHEEISDEYEKVKERVQSCENEKNVVKEKLLNALSDLKSSTSELENIKIDVEILKKENEELQRKTKILAEVTENLRKKTNDYNTLHSDFEELTKHHSALKVEAEALRLLNEQLKIVSIEHEKVKLEYKQSQETISSFKTNSEQLHNILAGMYKEQRDLRNTVQDLKGNIRVYCRVRPPLESEGTRPLFNINVVDACTIEVEKIELNSLSQSTRKGKLQHSFSFDGIFTRHSSQEDVFAEVSPMIQSALDGYNVCIFAYGQTGSGKTYTMEGGCGIEQYGIIPRAFNMIFTSIEDLKAMGWELTIRASFLEIYNEVIYDLLNSNKDQENHDIKMVNSKGTDLYVSNLREEEVKSSHEFISFMVSAQRNRQTAATLNNERSSRSHSVTLIKISAINEKRKEKFTSNLNLVDLAGSESGKTTQRMDETKHINRSLSELSKVIISLQSKQSHIPYRNSKLTHLLMPSLGGNSKTLMLVNINQFDDCFGETLNSLRFATKVNSCRVVKAKKNITMVDNI